MLNSPHAYSQNKAFTKHIVDALMQSYEEKLNLEVSILRKLYDEWEPTIKIKIKDHECYALCDLGASVSTILKTLCDILGFHDLDDCSLICTLRIPPLKSQWEGSMMFSLLQIEIWCPWILSFLI